jgi:hypothetical protein
LEGGDQPAERRALGGEDEPDAEQALYRVSSAGIRSCRRLSPAEVRRTRRLVRSNTFTPSRDSSTRMASLTPGWEMPSRSAVRPKWSSSARTRKIRSSRSSRSCHINQKA